MQSLIAPSDTFNHAPLNSKCKNSHDTAAVRRATGKPEKSK